MLLLLFKNILHIHYNDHILKRTAIFFYSSKKYFIKYVSEANSVYGEDPAFGIGVGFDSSVFHLLVL